MIYLATKTALAVEDAIQRDQGASYRGWLGKVLPHLGDAYREDQDGHRTHLGASLIGGSCARAIWYGFRWAIKPWHTGRILRLFNRGHLEEGRLIAAFLTAGFEFYQQDANGKQFRIDDHNGHFGGSTDGIIYGIPDIPPKQPCLTEFKTHGDKSFQKVKAEGVKEAKYQHYVQMQVYMRKLGVPVCLYVAVNKNDDELYMELVFLDAETADMMLDRAGKIIHYITPPKRISESPGYWQCRFCNAYSICQLHKTEEIDVNCRTCQHSTIELDKWVCKKDDSVIEKEKQLQGCNHYEVSPAIISN